MDAFSYRKPDATVQLYGLGARCLNEPASRRLDGEIYCALHNVDDWNPLLNHSFELAKENGQVFVEHNPGAGLVWIEVPRFTTKLGYAQTLLPEGLVTFFKDARRTCATALQARALSNEPPPLVSNIVVRATELLPNPL